MALNIVWLECHAREGGSWTEFVEGGVSLTLMALLHYQSLDIQMAAISSTKWALHQLISSWVLLVKTGSIEFFYLPGTSSSKGVFSQDPFHLVNNLDPSPLQQPLFIPTAFLHKIILICHNVECRKLFGWQLVLALFYYFFVRFLILLLSIKKRLFIMFISFENLKSKCWHYPKNIRYFVISWVCRDELC